MTLHDGDPNVERAKAIWFSVMFVVIWVGTWMQL